MDLNLEKNKMPKQNTLEKKKENLDYKIICCKIF